MTHRTQIRIPATYMRGGTSKGVFFRLHDLPPAARVPGPARDALLLRVIGSPDPYRRHIDGMGGATSSTSKVVILSRSASPEHDVDYLFGQVSIDEALVDWSGNCGNLSAAVGPFAITAGLVDPARLPSDGVALVRIRQANIGSTILAHVPMVDGAPQETGEFELDGVAFPGLKVRLDYVNLADTSGGSLFPTGNRVDKLETPGVGTLEATMINAGIPTVFVNAADVGCSGTERPSEFNGDPDKLARLESIRAHGAVRMGLIGKVGEAGQRQHTPKVAFVANPESYVAAGGRVVENEAVDLLVRALSMGGLHHAMMGTVAIAIGAAAAIPGTLVSRVAGGERNPVRIGHPSGTMSVGAEAVEQGGEWVVRGVTMSRSARVLMEGRVCVPGDSF